MSKKDNQFRYIDLIEKYGFERTEYSDSVHFDTYGYPNFYVSKQVFKTKKEKFHLDWDRTDLTVKLVRVSNDGVIIAKMPMINADVLLWTIDFYMQKHNEFPDNER